MDETQRTLILPKVSQVVQSSKERHQPAHNWSNIQECQTDQNIFFQRFFLLRRSDGQVPYTDAMARGPMRQDCCDCYRHCLHKCSPTSPQQNVNFESYQTKTRLSTWIRSLLKFTKEKKHRFVLDFFCPLRFSDVFLICLYLFDRFSSRNLCNISLKFWCYDSERTLKC